MLDLKPHNNSNLRKQGFIKYSNSNFLILSWGLFIKAVGGRHFWLKKFLITFYALGYTFDIFSQQNGYSREGFLQTWYFSMRTVSIQNPREIIIIIIKGVIILCNHMKGVLSVPFRICEKYSFFNGSYVSLKGKHGFSIGRYLCNNEI